MKIAIYYDSLLTPGGAERVVIKLANELNADIVTSGFNPELRKWLPMKGKVRDIGNLFAKIFPPLGILFEAPVRYMFTKITSEYDVNIFCGFTSIYAAKKHEKNIWYCFTPNRIMYDMKDKKLSEGSLAKRFLLWLHVALFAKKDKEAIENLQTIVAQSKTVRERVKKYYNREASVIYSPIESKDYHFKSFGDFFLTVSRLFSEKRVGLIAQAFKAMPDKKLVIVGNGPEKEAIEKSIKNAPNITLLSNVDDKQLKELYATCLATIFMSMNEDYGLIPLEANASGKLCIAANEGGCRETVKDNKSGFLIEATETAIKKQVENIDITLAKKLQKACLANVKTFDISMTVQQFRKVINSL